MNKQAYRCMTAARSLLIIDHPFFGCLVMHLRLVEAPFIPTMATDGRHLFYNPEFALALSEQEVVGVIAHEGYHCAYRHHVRLGDRDLEDWNRATDYVINNDLTKAGFKLPSFALLDKQFDRMSSEEVYTLIRQQKPPQSGGGGKDDKKGKDGNGQGSSSGNGKPDSGNGQSQQGTDGQGNPVAGPANAPDPGKMGGIVPAAPQWDKNAIEAESARWEQIARQAVSVAKAANAGTVPGFLERLVEDLENPRVDWEAKLRRYVDESIEKGYTWMTPNRRFVGRGLYLPGLKSDKLKHIVNVMDTSGSITNKLVSLYSSEMSAFLNEGLCDKLTVIYADTRVQNVETFERGDELKLNPKGGGGTNFRPAMKYIADNCDDASVVLFFTDLLTRDFGDDTGIPHLWVVYGTRQMYQAVSPRVPYGETMHIEE